MIGYIWQGCDQNWYWSNHHPHSKNCTVDHYGPFKTYEDVTADYFYAKIRRGYIEKVMIQ